MFASQPVVITNHVGRTWRVSSKERGRAVAITTSGNGWATTIIVGQRKITPAQVEEAYSHLHKYWESLVQHMRLGIDPDDDVGLNSRRRTYIVRSLLASLGINQNTLVVRITPASLRAVRPKMNKQVERMGKKRGINLAALYREPISYSSLQREALTKVIQSIGCYARATH